jgi:hypothetical protein
MIVSLNEIAETAKKASRGCGHYFGIAEEMAFAVRWLCERGLPGTEKLLHALEQFEAVQFEISDTVGELRITGNGGKPLPALTLAPSIAELLVAHRRKPKIVKVRSLTHPLLLVPFLARAADSDEVIWSHFTTIDANSVMINCAGGGAQICADDASALLTARADQLTCRWGTGQTDIPELCRPHQLCAKHESAIQRGCDISNAVWEKLLNFAHNTYVPSSEASRLTGAGAGLTDND